ncbi:MAG: hypothetical protein B6U94_04330 [Thermofilum sp. ex4484_79]|nr:MAG: hypothetical protein B6U94_04330 [Thermofilum sp. ex4484_79]
MPQTKLIQLVAVFIVGLLVGAGLIYAFMGGKPTAGVGSKNLPKEIKIGVLVDLSGPLSSTGKKIQYGLKLAEEDLNDYAKSLGLNVKFKFLFEDTQTIPERALSRLQSLVAQGVKVVIGPLASSEVKNIKSFADSNKIVVVSPSSTAPALAVADDFVFRLVPTDIFQGKAVAKMIFSKGYKKVAVIYRKDTWGEGLFNAFKKNFEELGGTVVGVVDYDPDAKDLSAEVLRFSDIVKKGGEGTAVLLISFDDDGVMILNSAKNDETLTSAEWFGTDGTAYMDKIVVQVGDVAVEVGGLKSTLFAPTQSEKWKTFKERYSSKFGLEPESYTLNSYDAAWVIALTIIQVGQYDGQKIAKALPSVAGSFFGVSGWTKLDKNGDRAGGDYEICAIKMVDGKPKWVRVGVYSFTADSVTWFEG